MVEAVAEIRVARAVAEREREVVRAVAERETQISPVHNDMQ